MAKTKEENNSLNEEQKIVLSLLFHHAICSRHWHGICEGRRKTFLAIRREEKSSDFFSREPIQSNNSST